MQICVGRTNKNKSINTIQYMFIILQLTKTHMLWKMQNEIISTKLTSYNKLMT